MILYCVYGVLDLIICCFMLSRTRVAGRDYSAQNTGRFARSARSSQNSRPRVHSHYRSRFSVIHDGCVGWEWKSD
jgi:hypothetical protein